MNPASNEAIELSPTTIARYSKIPMLVPPGLHSLLTQFKALNEIATLDEVLDAMKDYIFKRSLYDRRNPRIINCQDDDLGKELGAPKFTLYEIKKIVLKNLLAANKGAVLEFPVPSAEDSNLKRKGGPDVDSLSDAESAKRSCTQSTTQRAASPLYFVIPPPAAYDSSSDTAMSIQGYETTFVRDSSDGDLCFLDEGDSDFDVNHILAVQQTYEVEYEVESDTSGGGSVSDTESELSETKMDILKAALYAVLCKNGKSDSTSDEAIYKTDSDKEFWADASSEEGLSDVEISESDKWKCAKCGSYNKPLMRFCTKCWDQRVGWLPDRHERRQRPRRKTKSVKQNNQTKKVETGESLPKVTENEDSRSSDKIANGHLSPSAEVCDSGISSQEFLDVPSQSSCEPGASSQNEIGVSSQNSVSSEKSVTSQPSSQELCSLCLLKPKNATIVHGNIGHQMSCYRCARKLQSMKKPCPICRRTISRVIHQIVT